MARGYIFNKNFDSGDTFNLLSKPEVVIGVSIDKTIPTHMNIFTDKHVFIVDRLIDQDKSTDTNIVFRLAVHVISRYAASLNDDYPVTHPNDFSVYKYIGNKQLVCINTLNENYTGDHYVAFFSDSFNKIMDGLYVKITNKKTDGNPIEDYTAFLLDKDVFIPISGEHLFDDQTALTMVHCCNNEIVSLLIYTKDHTYEKVEFKTERSEDHGVLVELTDLKFSSNIMEFDSSEEGFEWHKSPKMDHSIVECHAIFMMKIIHTPDGVFLWDKKNLL